MSREKILCGKEEIYRIAIDIVNREGMEALSIRSIAKALGVSPMTLYNYVDNLKSIKKHVLIDSFDRMYAYVFEKLSSSAFPVDKFAFCRVIATGVYEFAMNNREAFLYMFGEGQRCFCEDAEIRPLYTYISKLTKRSKATQKDWDKNEKGYRLLEIMIFSISHQVASGAQIMSAEEYSELVDFYLEKCIGRGEN